MTTRQKINLGGYMQKCANKYTHGGLLGLENELIATFEENENSTDLGNILAQRILDSHMIAFDREHEKEFREFWINAASQLQTF